MNKKTIIWIFPVFILIQISFAGIEDIIEQSKPVFYCGENYELEAIYISANEVKFRLNNETSDLLKYHDLFEFKEGSSIYIREILEEEAKEGIDKVSIRFYPKICPLTEEKINKTEAVEEINKPKETAVELTASENIPAKEAVQKPSFLEIIINWIRNLFRR